jgi:hypothetical protein
MHTLSGLAQSNPGGQSCLRTTVSQSECTRKTLDTRRYTSTLRATHNLYPSTNAAQWSGSAKTLLPFVMQPYRTRCSVTKRHISPSHTK